jgi:tripartite-type tricarboxylate transporter receptor subunit TctC
MRGSIRAELAAQAETADAEQPGNHSKDRRMSVLRSAVAACCSIVLLAMSDQGASAQTRTIKIVVPSTPGGGADVLARLLADQMSRAQGQTFVVENRPGASNTIGTEVVSRAAPDGNTLLITTPEFVINAHLRKLSYDPLTSFEPICTLARSPQLFVVNGASPYKTLGDMLDAARAKPGELTIASAGPASSPHVAIETLKRAAKANITYVPYQGTGPAINALMGQHLTAVLASYPNVVSQVKGGQLRALATTSQARIADLPDVPTIADAGFKDVEVEIWFGVVAPAKTPKETVAQLASWFSAAMQAPEVKSKLDVQGLFAVGQCGAEAGAFTRAQYDRYGSAIHAADIKAN